ncbi:MAG: hydrogenase small subunit [Sulfuricella sp.]|nr:hydrogenase small subunit [Sulfuricella sp.]
MSDRPTLVQYLELRGVSRREFLGFCTAAATALALPASAVPAIAAALGKAQRPSVIWLSFQECTGCTESITRSHSPSLEALIFDFISLDYHHTLQAASGEAAEAAREAAMKAFYGKYLLIVDGSIPTKDGGVYSTIAGVSNLAMLKEAAQGAAAIIALGSCAAFGGIPAALPNPTGAQSVGEIIKDKPVVNVSGCPPIPVVITGVLTHFLTFGSLPELDALGRPKVFYGETIHDRCYRRPFYDQGKFAKSFDDEGARNGWCLFELGCKGPTTYNACATTKWNQGASFPIETGHGCLGCSEPKFWDAGGFYQPLSAPISPVGQIALGAAAVGVAVGTAMALNSRATKDKARAAHRKAELDDLSPP